MRTELPQSSIMPRSDLKIPMPAGVKPPPRSVFHSAFAYGDRVHIDTDKDLIGVVTAFLWRDGEGHTVEVCWFHNGADHSAWFQPWRLHLVD